MAYSSATRMTSPLPPTARALRSFQSLLDQIEVVRVCAAPKRYRGTTRLIVDQFERGLNREFESFKDILSGLTDQTELELQQPEFETFERVVRMRCDSSYGRYVGCIGEVVQALVEISRYLGWDDPDTARSETLEYDSARIEEIIHGSDQWATFILALGTITGVMGGALQVQLSKIEDTNKKLRKISNEARTGLDKVQLDALRGLRKQANTVAEVLGQENGFSCHGHGHGCCERRHSTFICVREDLGALGTLGETSPTALSDVCSLVLHENSEGGAPIWDWADFHIGIPGMKGPGVSGTQGPSTGLADSDNTSTSRSSLTKLKSALKGTSAPRRVGLGAFTPRFSSISPRDPTESRNAARPLESDPAVGLCAFIDSARSSRSPARNQQHITLSRHTSQLQLKLLNTPSSMSQKKPSTLRYITLPTKQKLQIASKVASGLFYFYSTPWLRDSWNNNDMYLYPRRHGFAPEPMLANSTNPRGLTPPDTFGSLTPPFIAQFGCFLLHLCFGSPWDEIKAAFHRGPEHDEPSRPSEADHLVFSDIYAWANDPNVAPGDRPCYEEGNSYLEAILNCFSGDFGLRPGTAASMDDDDFSLAVYRKILCPLQFALEDFQARQIRIFGPPIMLPVPETRDPSEGLRDGRLLFDDEEIKGSIDEVRGKEMSATKWFVKYNKVLDIAGRTSPSRPERPEDRIKVAILDTGVDTSHDKLKPFWRRQQIIYQDFVGPGPGIPQDEHGHGTHVTSILFDVVKNVDVYVGRITKDGKTFNSERVEKAIDWAVSTKKVHIISLSFGFPNVDYSLEPIRLAILRAHAAGVIVFAAAGNAGKSEPVAFPACMDEVITVGATDGLLKLSDFVPTPGPGKRLCAIGEAIEGAWIRQGRGGDIRRGGHATRVRRAGTSYATPVVAGVAAMVMDFVWADRRATQNVEPSAAERAEQRAEVGTAATRTAGTRGRGRYEHQTLRTKRGMLAVLGLMIKRAGTESEEHLVPWRLFTEGKDQSTVIGQTRSGILEEISVCLRNVYM